MNLFIWLGNKIGGWLSKPEPKPLPFYKHSSGWSTGGNVQSVFHTAHDRAAGPYLQSVPNEEQRALVRASAPVHAENERLALARIAQIKRERASLMAQIAKAEKRHEPRAELRAKLAKLTAEQISLERLWECG